MITLLGEYSCKLDAKSRLLLPSTLKRQLGEGDDASRFVIKKSIYKECLELYPMKEWEKLIEIIRKKINPFNRKENQFLMEFHRGTAELELDASNRLTIPKRLLEKAAIGNDVVLIGVGGYIEFWDEKVFESQTMDNEEFEKTATEIFKTGFNS
ncbi:MAG: division/cell wall cluster transcriptional repressor MraZ [Bacteroidales bacterium]